MSNCLYIARTRLFLNDSKFNDLNVHKKIAKFSSDFLCTKHVNTYCKQKLSYKNVSFRYT